MWRELRGSVMGRQTIRSLGCLMKVRHWFHFYVTKKTELMSQVKISGVQVISGMVQTKLKAGRALT